ncbi:MAG: hypothetical protein LBT89_11805 [Planctomycetaceae bacterium]|jgi:hypothetical protein|nr:hypothetical protein [Planctomycetaceae bacterium]
MLRFIRPVFWAAFVIVCAVIVSRFQPQTVTVLTDGQCILFWHAQTRCPACLKLEEAVNTCLDSDNRCRLYKLEYDVPANQKLASELHVGTATVILAEVKDGKIIRKKDLTEPVWKLLEDESKLVSMLRKELNEFAPAPVTGTSNSR